MVELIEREAANEFICQTCDAAEGTFCVRCDGNPLSSIPAADVVEVRHGQWVYEPGHIPHCSECGRYSDDADTGEAICCPFCGARMDGRQEPPKEEAK